MLSIGLAPASPLVSVVIPTRNRQQLLARSLASASNQTYKNIEIIVVIDGPDPATVDYLTTVPDARLRVVPLKENVRGGEARNIGVRTATGSWIAFLDDDDEWLPMKVEQQVLAAQRAGPEINFIACRWDARFAHDRKILPSRFPTPQEDWSEYIYVGRDTIPTTCYLVSRDLMLEMPFLKGLLFNQDIDWLLRVQWLGKLHPIWLEEAYVIYYGDDNRPRTSKVQNWKFAYDWARSNLGTLLSQKAFAHCILVACLPRARKAPGAIRIVPSLFKDVVRLGKVTPGYCIHFAVCSLFGYGLKDRLRSTLNRAFRRRSRKLANHQTDEESSQ